MTYLDYVEVGDYYYADGSWRNPNIDVDEDPIGVVFKTGAGGTGDFLDKPENYGWNDKEIHGYVVALNDATPDAVIWGDKVSVPGVPEYLNLPKTNSYTGFTYTKSIEDWGKGGKNYTAAKAAIEYKPAPDEKSKSSGWYLPSLFQLEDIENLPDRKALIEKADGTDFFTDDRTKTRYWSCILTSNDRSYVWNFDDNKNAKEYRSNKWYVRAVLTF